MLALALLAMGLGISLLAAHTLATNDHQRTQAEFSSSADATAAALAMSLQHEEDLVVSARAYLSGDAEGPNETEQGLLRWTRAVEALKRYPEIEGGGELEFVTSQSLGAFAAARMAEPTGGRTDGGFSVTPPGHRSFYCLLALSFSRHPIAESGTPASVDYCANPRFLKLLMQARNSGLNAYFPVQSVGSRVLAVYTPVYRGAGIPVTLGARRARFRGLFGTTLVPQVILRAARRGREGVAIALRYGRSRGTEFRAGTLSANRQTTTRTLTGGWVMEASEPRSATGVLRDRTALDRLVGGSAIALLISLLVYILGTGRQRAVALVREQTLEITHQALHDPLTGLPNRRLTIDRGEQMLARSRREPGILTAALYIDIDRFKQVNDNFGHAAGDTLLAVVAERLVSVLREQDTVGRLSGDEFAVLLESNGHEAPPQAIAERIIEALHEPILLEDGRSIVARVSIGVAIGSPATAEQLLRDADLALYAAKADGKDRAVLFEARMQRVATARLDLEQNLSRAIEDEQLFLLYQPILELDSRRMTGVEALIRWRHPELGVVPPNDFIPMAEETGQIVPIGRWVLREACIQAARWASDGHKLNISVNVSACQLDRDDFPEDVRLALVESGLEPSTLTLEITETALMCDAAAAARRLGRVKALGVRVAIDDFGTGSNALVYLRHFDVDAIKIDRSFLGNISNSSESAAIVHTLVELAGLLGIESFAEGIEDPEQLAWLRADGCDQGQGFLFARPLEAGAVESFLLSGLAPHRTAA